MTAVSVDLRSDGLRNQPAETPADVEGPTTSTPRREVVRYLAGRLAPGETGYVKAKYVSRETSLSPSEAGVWLARVAGQYRRDEVTPRPSPVFVMKRYSENNTRTVWRVTRLETHRAVFPLLGGGEP